MTSFPEGMGHPVLHPHRFIRHVVLAEKGRRELPKNGNREFPTLAGPYTPLNGVITGHDRNGGVARHEDHLEAGSEHFEQLKAHGTRQEDNEEVRPGGYHPTQIQDKEIANQNIYQGRFIVLDHLFTSEPTDVLRDVRILSRDRTTPPATTRGSVGSGVKGPLLIISNSSLYGFQHSSWLELNYVIVRYSTIDIPSPWKVKLKCV